MFYLKILLEDFSACLFIYLFIIFNLLQVLTVQSKSKTRWLKSIMKTQCYMVQAACVAFYFFSGHIVKHLTVYHSVCALLDSDAMNYHVVKTHNKLWRPTGGETGCKVSAQNKQRWSECLNLADIHCGTVGDCICVTNCCLMNSGKTKSRCIHATSGFFWWRKESLALV